MAAGSRRAQRLSGLKPLAILVEFPSARVSADIVLLNENIEEINHALETAKLTQVIIKQNFIWAIGYNLVALPFAALGFLSPWMAAIGMSVSSLTVVLNALRLNN